MLVSGFIGVGIWTASCFEKVKTADNVKRRRVVRVKEMVKKQSGVSRLSSSGN